MVSKLRAVVALKWLRAVLRGRLLTAVEVGVVMCSLAACSSRPMLPVGEIPHPTRPDAQVQRATTSLIESKAHAQGRPVAQNPAEQARVQRIVDRLARAAGAEDFRYPVTIVSAGKDANAFAVQGSNIVVYEELLRRVPDDDELATVLGHEMGHILGRHSADDGMKERKSTVSVASTLLGTMAGVGVAMVGGGSAGARAVASLTRATTSAVGTGAYVKAYNRDMEREADQIGIVLMAKACFDPNRAISFWKRADEVLGTAGGSFYSTHPSNADRLNRLSEILPVAEKMRAETVCAPEPKSAPAAAAKAPRNTKRPAAKSR